jgi:hypothetical protein
MNKVARAFVGSVAIWVFSAESSFAGDLMRKIPQGASIGEVIGLWGEPTEKIEKVLKHEVVWQYPQGAKVVFKNGKVAAWIPPASVVQAQAEKAAAVVSTPVSEQVARETQDLVRDIAKEVPSGPDVPYVEPPQPPSQPPAIANGAAPVRGAPPAIAPELDLSDEID